MRTDGLDVVLCMKGILVFSMGCRSKAAVVANAQLSLSLPLSVLQGICLRTTPAWCQRSSKVSPVAPTAHNRAKALAG